MVALLATINDGVRKVVLDAMHGELTAIVPGVQVHALTRHVADMVPSGNPALMVFGAVAFVLTVVMFKM